MQHATATTTGVQFPPPYDAYQQYHLLPLKPQQPTPQSKTKTTSQSQHMTTFAKQVYHDFQQFMYTNNVLIVATGWGIGTATKDMIERLVKDMVVPLIQWISKIGFINKGYNQLLEYVASTKWEGVFNGVTNITWDFMIWIFVIVMTFILLEYILNRWIVGMRTTVPEKESAQFAKAKAAAKESIIPDKKDAELLEKKIKLEEVTGEKLIQKEEQILKSIPLAPTYQQHSQPAEIAMRMGQ
jgi:large-conductance mechanosensitive channel